MSSTPLPDPGARLLALYDRALPQVYGYVRARVGSNTVAEDVTSETFLAAVAAINRGTVPDLSTAWLVTVARNKLVDHWRRQAREERGLALVEHDDVADDNLEGKFERARAHDVLNELGAHHRAALTLRYLDGLSVPEVAAHLDRTVHATEALLVRARRAFRALYTEGSCDE